MSFRQFTRIVSTTLLKYSRIISLTFSPPFILLDFQERFISANKILPPSFFSGHTQQFFGLTFGSVLKDNSWKGSRN